jgi:hypothetical protein
VHSVYIFLRFVFHYALNFALRVLLCVRC